MNFGQTENVTRKPLRGNGDFLTPKSDNPPALIGQNNLLNLRNSYCCKSCNAKKYKFSHKFNLR
eukprot:snap_masked-scaffold_2-processed-gene-9.27-mRNA-1 protein AED:1.00 eAED:1.00 QI:0/-1/0/0/-1/1/1/0/63